MVPWIISFLSYLSEQLAIYLGIVMFLLDIIGGMLTIIVFYLILISIFNIINLFVGLLSGILISSFGIDWTLTSSFYCVFRWYCLYFGVLISFTMICLSRIDQYLSTCSHREAGIWAHGFFGPDFRPGPKFQWFFGPGRKSERNFVPNLNIIN